MTNETENTTDYLFPMDTIIKIVSTKKGLRYYRGNSRAVRFFPLSKKDYKDLDLTKFEVFKETGNFFTRMN